MVNKYQLALVRSPLELIDVTLNHLDSLVKLTQNKFLIHLIETSKHHILSIFKSQSSLKQLHLVRQTLLNYFIKIKTRVSALLKNGTQDMTGDFILDSVFTIVCQCQEPGDIIYYDQDGQASHTFRFNFGGQCTVKDAKTSLGMNM